MGLEQSIMVVAAETATETAADIVADTIVVAVEDSL